MKKKIKKWNKEHLDLIQNLSNVIQTIMIIIMGITLIQGYNIFQLSQKQFESSISPSISYKYSFDKLTIENTGVIDISNIEIVGGISANYDCNEQENNKCMSNDSIMKATLISNSVQQIHKSILSKNEKFELSIPKLFSERNTFDVTPKTKFKVLGIIIKYRRHVDSNPYYKLFVFIKFDVAYTLTNGFPIYDSGGNLNRESDLFLRVKLEITEKFKEYGYEL